MSKSRGNTVDPDEVLSKYGADSLRLFILFAAPPEDQLEWNSDGLEGAWRFLNRVYQIVEKRYIKNSSGAMSGIGIKLDSADQILDRERNHAIKHVSQSFEQGFKFNTAISQLMILANAIDKYKAESTAVLNISIETLVLLLAPFAPHLCEELWQMMGKNDATITQVPWPSFDEKALKQTETTYAVQINGKIRAQFTAPTNATQEQLRQLCLADTHVAKYVPNAGAIKKFIVVPQKLVSIVV